ncbi:phospholipase D family protein [Micropruina sp.]|uniref:phospholipase D family protein n=1 Tax=Micropruina sp. TaxID=2737536 RepID=UPI0039E71354
MVLLDQLRPPPGYRLQAAVATTFTLDLTTAVVPPLAFASFEMRDTADPVAALEAIRSCTDRVDIFCQAGQLTVPRRHSDLMAYLEPMVHPVRRPRPSSLFHPKVWFLHYRADDQPERFRLLCSTRNLTDSQAWDAVVSLDGVARPHTDPSNEPLAKLIEALPRLAVAPLAPDRAARVAELADAARRVDWERPEHVTSLAFHLWGVPRVTPAAPDFSGYRHLIVSPFCNADGIAQLTRKARGSITVVSRAETFDALGSEPFAGCQTFILDPLASLSAPAGDPDDADNPADDDADATSPDPLSGLHAKITVVERDKKAHVFIGSANATSAAFGSNVEFAIELTGGHSKLGVGTYLGPDAPFARMLQPYQPAEPAPVDPEDERLRALLNSLRALAEIEFTLTVQSSTQGGLHDLQLASGTELAPRPGHELKAELLTLPGQAVDLTGGSLAAGTFRDVVVPNITPFVALHLTDPGSSPGERPLAVSSVVHARLINDPPTRLDEVLARQVDTPEKFLRFVALLLGLGGDANPVLPASIAEKGATWASAGAAGIFEVIINALASNPDALRDLARLVERLESTEVGRRVLPDGFQALWQPVRAALDAMGETR